MVSYVEDSEFNHIVIVEVDKDNVVKKPTAIEVNDKLHSLNAYSKKERNLVLQQLGSEEQSSTDTRKVSSFLSIEDLLNVVNEYQPSILSKDVLEHLGKAWPGEGLAWYKRLLFFPISFSHKHAIVINTMQ